MDTEYEKIIIIVKNLHNEGKLKNIKLNNGENKSRISCRNIKYWLLRGFEQSTAEVITKSRIPGSYEYFRIFKNDNHENASINKIKWANDHSVTLDNFIKKHGKQEGTKKWETYCEKQRIKNTYEYKKQKYGWDEKKFDEFNKSRSVTKENLIKKWGKEIGLEKWNRYCSQQAYTNKLEYFIEKYGKEKGEKKYKLVNFLKSHSYETYVYKFGPEIGKIKYLEFLNKRENNNFKTYSVSNSSKILFDSIFSRLNDNNLFYNCFYNSHNGEKLIIAKDNSCYYLDFYCENNKRAIEFFGNYWHANPSMYDSDELIHYPNKCCKIAKDIWLYDDIRIKKILETNEVSDILVIWENDWTENPDLILTKTISFLKG
jgi:hypothetical protein